MCNEMATSDSGRNATGAGKVDAEKALYTELWRACAGPLVTVPSEGELVFYFPQGHIEQVEASTNQASDQQMPVYNLPSKILCRVINVLLKAEPDTDEVYAQVTLMPEPDQDENAATKEPMPPPPPRFHVHSFCKTLTASDTSTHGGFSVLRRHADECLPPMDMSRQPPTQELVAKDLHANEWRFRHIFRGSSKVTVDPSQASGFSRVLQGQEISTLRGNFVENNESESCEKPVVWPPLLDDEKADVHSASRRCLPDKWLPLGRPESSFTDLLSGFGVQASSSHGFHLPTGGQTVPASLGKRQALDKENDFSLLGKQWSLVSSGLSLNLMDSGLKDADTLYQMQGTSRCNVFNEYPTLPAHRIDNQQGNWLTPQSMLPYIQMSTRSGEMMPKPMASLQPEAVKPKEGNCKLFGIPLVSKSASIDPAMLRKNSPIGSASNMHFGIHPHQFPSTESDQRSEQSKGSKLLDDGITVNDQEEQFQTSHPGTRDREGKGLVNSTRSCTKVHKQGMALGRSVDLAKFNNYEELIAELDHLFDFNGELKARNRNWLVVYTDDEGDMMLVGDDPWQEFCGMVCKIFIYTKDEVQRMNPGTLNSKGEDNSSVAEGSDAKEAKNVQLPSDSSPEDS